MSEYSFYITAVISYPCFSNEVGNSAIEKIDDDCWEHKSHGVNKVSQLKLIFSKVNLGLGHEGFQFECMYD